jgi:ribulose 1,5-bisphosphate synthetase/thiazole synthase
MYRRALAILLALCGLGAVAQAEDKVFEADVVVYGDASGGVTTAVQAARMGKSVILVSQYGHLGGMTSSGLGWSDLGNPAILGGLSREFYHKVYLHYQNDTAWVQACDSPGSPCTMTMASRTWCRRGPCTKGIGSRQTRSGSGSPTRTMA